MRRKEAKQLVLDALEGVANQALHGLVDDDIELTDLQIDEDDLEELATRLSDELGANVSFEGKTTIGGLIDVVAEIDET